MKVWITKYALTQGIIEAETNKISNNGCCKPYWVDKNGNERSTYLAISSRDFTRDKESAIARAEEMRQKKIASLKKQIQKLEKMKFE